MKRESINEAEAGMNEDSLMPLVDDMLKNWQEGFEKVNEMFGTDISVSLNSSWENVQERSEALEEPEEEKEEEADDDVSDSE